MTKNTITTRSIAQKTGMKHIAIVHSVERNMDALMAVGTFTPLLINYATGGRSGKEYLIDFHQEKLLMLLSNNGCKAVLDYKMELAREL